MTEHGNTREALGRAGKRAAYHLLRALVEGLKAVEAVIDEIGGLRDRRTDQGEPVKQRIEIE